MQSTTKYSGRIWIEIFAILLFWMSNAIAQEKYGDTVFVPSGNTFGKAAVLGTNDNYSLSFITNTAERLRINTNGQVGIGTIFPDGKLHIHQRISDPAGIVFEIPRFIGFPEVAYTPKEAMRWQGGETKFGMWRQYFNQKEQSWALVYNAQYNSQTNKYDFGRDSGNVQANIGAVMRFDVAEGNSGLNVFEIAFAPPGKTTDNPIFGLASHYSFSDGRVGVPGKSLVEEPPMPAQLSISGAANMDAILSLSSNITVAPNTVDLISDGSNPGHNRGTAPATPKLFKIRNRLTGTDLMLIKTDTGNVGIGMQATTNIPSTKLQVGNGDIYTSTAGSGHIAKSPDGKKCARIGIDNSGNIAATSVTCP